MLISRKLTLALTTGLATAGLATAGSTAAQADYGFASLGASATGLDGTFTRQAGAHPDLTLRMTFPRTTNPNPDAVVPTEAVREVDVDLPPGVTGDPTAAPTCRMAVLASSTAGLCPVAAQIGYVRVMTKHFETFDGLTEADGAIGTLAPLYNMERPDNAPGLFAFNFADAIVTIVPRVRPGDYGISALSAAISQAFPVYGVEVSLWGVPADPIHDPLRQLVRDFTGGPSPDQRKPFLSNATSCTDDPLTTRARLRSWERPDTVLTGSFNADFDGTPFVTDGCDKVPFAPTIDVGATSPVADAPSGLEVELKVPQSEAPDGLSTAHVRDVSVALPKGMSVSPGSAAGLGACSPAQIGLGSNDAPTCPASSKLGTVTVESPVLDKPLEGTVFLAQPDVNPFNSLLALYVVAKGPGFTVKLAGRVEADPVDGQLTATFRNNPQLPFSALRMRFDGGPQAALATPEACGSYVTDVSIRSWASDRALAMTPAMSIGEGCGPRGFDPVVRAGSASSVAGSDAPFSMTLVRPDRQQNLSQVRTVLPAGLLARIRDAELCPEAQAAAGTCSPASRVGATHALAGPGSAPLPARGDVYLTGSYGDAPYGLSIVVPTAGQAGPFDLGNVVVRARIYVDRASARVTVQSDPLPTILRGFPLRLQRVDVSIDRPGFTFNPTNCDPKSIETSVSSTQGATVTRSSRFAVSGCAALEFEPRLAMTVGTAKKKTTSAGSRTPSELRDSGHPALSARLTMGAGGANNGRATVVLPKALALEPDNANGLCEPVDAAKDQCPAASIVGNVTAVTPLLNGTVKGPVYFVRGERKDPKSGRTIRTLPKLFVPLTSSENPRLKIELHASSDVKNDRLVTTFDDLPDVPITTFDLTINGGKHGILVVSDTNMCSSAQYADNEFIAQNNKRYVSTIGLNTACPLHVAKSSRSGSALKLTLGGLAPGKVTVTGKGLPKKTKTITAAKPQVQDQDRMSTTATVNATTHATVTAPLSRSMRRSLSRGHDVKVKVAVAFKAQGAKKTTKTTKTITIHPNKKK
jgi:hypothetical protein